MFMRMNYAVSGAITIDGVWILSACAICCTHAVHAMLVLEVPLYA